MNAIEDKLRKLSDKLGKEYVEFIQELKTKEPSEIIEQASKVVMMDEILCTVDNEIDLGEHSFLVDEKVINSLLERDDSLNLICDCWIERGAPDISTDICYSILSAGDFSISERKIVLDEIEKELEV